MNEEEFKAECIKADGKVCLTKGKIYSVKQSKEYDNYYELINDSGAKEVYFKSRFKAMENKKTWGERFYESKGKEIIEKISKEVVEGEKVEEVIKVRCKRNGFDFEKDKTYKAERTITGAYKLMNDKGVYHIFFGTDFSNYFEKVTDDVLMVECIDNKIASNELSVGKTYEVLEENERRYKVLNDRNKEETYFKERFKPVEPQKEEKEEYTVMEVLEMPTGTKLKLFPYDEFEREIMVVGGVADVKTLLYVDKEGCHEEGVIISSWIMEKPRFRVVEEPKPVTTSEAMKALDECKTIRSYKGYEYKKNSKKEIECITEMWSNVKYIYFEELQGKWIIL